MANSEVQGTGVFIAGKELDCKELRAYTGELEQRAARRIANGHTPDKNSMTRSLLDEAARYRQILSTEKI